MMMKMKRPREEDYFAFIKAVQKTPKYHEFLQAMKEYDSTNLKSVTTRIKKIFRDHSNLIHGFNMIFLPEEYARIEEDDRVSSKPTKRLEAEDSDNKMVMSLYESDSHQNYRFFEKVMKKEKFADPDDCKKYLQGLHLYSKKKISEGELKDMVGGLLKYGCVAFPRTANKDKVQEERETGSEAPASKKRKFEQPMMTDRLLIRETHNSNGKKDKVHPNPRKDEKETGSESPALKRRKSEEPMMIDRLLNCEKDNPSYQLSTERNLASGRTELGVAVLNDSWVSAESNLEGDETYHYKKNVYEKNLFRFEDNRCEHDRQFELVKVTVECVQELLQKIAENTINAGSIRLEDHFKVLQIGCIKQLYGESWQDVADALQKDAKYVLPGILTQLQKKLDEVTSRLSVTYKKKMNAVYSKNFRKSLDYGNSSSGEQQDITSSKDEGASTSIGPNVLAEPTT